MVLVDTSVWISHLRDGNDELAALLNDGEVACHPFIVGELACENLKNRTMVLSLLEALPTALVGEHREVLAFIDNNNLMGKGLGYVDIHLIVSAKLTELSLWTFDRRLKQASGRLNLEYQQRRTR
jgi:predicted nucleic acid-binding protein